ncbi:MAG: hypothetical protein ACYC5O_14805 [Anaerolineae bacterium]
MEQTGSLAIGVRRRGSLLLSVLLPVVVVAAALGGWAVWRAQTMNSIGRVPPMPQSAAMEERFGIRFTFLAVTADGGLLDLRYRVIDQDKAKNFGHYTETSPMLIVESTGVVVDVTQMGRHNHRMEPGRIYYILFRNMSDAIHPGDLVTIDVGGVRLEHIVAQ